MALVKGTNCGFCAVAPSADPNGTSTSHQFQSLILNKDVAPVNAVRITSIGFWNNSGDSTNVKIGLYDWDIANDRPGNLLASESISVSGAGWYKSTSINVLITPGNYYSFGYLLLQGSGLNEDYLVISGERRDALTLLSDLPNPFGAGSTPTTSYRAFYALWEAAPAPAPVSTKIASGWANDYKKKEKKKEEVITSLSIKILAPS